MQQKRILRKIILLGDSGYCQKKFSDKYRATIGADFLTKEENFNGQLIRLQLWDTAGQERFQSLETAFYRGADCCILVYDITNSKTFKQLSFCKDKFIYSINSDPTQFPFLVVGNKTDKEQKRQVSWEEGDKWCKDQGANFMFFECSAKDYFSIEPIFTNLITLLGSNAFKTSNSFEEKKFEENDLSNIQLKFEKDCKNFKDQKLSSKIIQNCC